MAECIFKDAARSGPQRRLIKARYYRSIAQSSLRLKVLRESGFGARGAIIRKWLVTRSQTSRSVLRAT